MPRVLVSLLLSLMCLGTIQAAEGLPAEQLNALKSATVFLKYSLGEGVASGSGFIISSGPANALLVTNSHVVAEMTKSTNLQVIVDSGTTQERTLRGTVLFQDTEQDLALVEITGKDLPQPIRIDISHELRETLPVYILGFPFGEELKTSERNPNLTVGTGTISSLRRDGAGLVSVLQIGGDINPGNSGGPVLLADGSLVGVAQAHLVGTQIGLAIPSTVLQKMLIGSCATPTLINSSGLAVNIVTTLIDPMHAISSVSMLLAPLPKAMPKPNSSGAWDPISSTSCDLATAGPQAKGSITLGHDQVLDGKILCQFKIIHSDKSESYSKPMAVLVGPETAANGSLVAGDLIKDIATVAKAATADAAAAPDEPLTLRLPKPIVQTEVAGGGRYLVLKLDGLAAIYVYDLQAGKISRTIPLPSTNFIYAAGGDTLLLGFLDTNILQTWNLATGEKILTKPCPYPVLCTLAMGHANGSQALMRSAVGTDQLARSAWSLFDTSSLEVVPCAIPVAAGSPRQAMPLWSSSYSGDCYRDYMHARCDADMTLISLWCTSHSPSGVGIMLRNGTDIQFHYEHDSQGSLAMGDDGLIYATSGNIFNSMLKNSLGVSGCCLIPGIGGGLFLSISQQNVVSLHTANNAAPLLRMNLPLASKPDADGRHPYFEAWAAGDFLLDRHLLFNPLLGAIVVIPLDDPSKIIQIPFNLKAVMAKAGVDYLMVTSHAPHVAYGNVPLSYQLEAISSKGEISYELELAPTGMSISPSGLIQWVHPESTNGSEQVVVLVKDAGRQQIYHTFDLSVKANQLTPQTTQVIKVPVVSGPLSSPSKLLINNKHLVICDSGHNRILITEQSGTWLATIGSGKPGLADGAAKDAQFNNPQGIAQSSDGKLLYIADCDNHAIRCIDLVTQQVSTLAGTGQAGSDTTYQGPGKTALLNSPQDLLLHDNMLYIAMSGFHQVWRYDLLAGSIGAFAGTGRDRNANGPAASAAFGQPQGLAIVDQVLYLVDAEMHTLRAISLEGELPVSTVAGTGSTFEAGSSDGTGSDARFRQPQGIAVLDSDHLVIADAGNNALRIVQRSTNTTSTLDVIIPSNKTTLAGPEGLVVADGRIWVADSGHHRIVSVNPQDGSSKIIAVCDAPVAAAKPAAELVNEPVEKAPTTYPEIEDPDGLGLRSATIMFLKDHHVTYEPGIDDAQLLELYHKYWDEQRSKDAGKE